MNVLPNTYIKTGNNSVFIGSIVFRLPTKQPLRFCESAIELLGLLANMKLERNVDVVGLEVNWGKFILSVVKSLVNHF